MADPTDVNGEMRTVPAAHPLIWAALLIWLSVEAIGDGLLALVSLLAGVSGTVTSTTTVATESTAETSPTPTPTPS